MVLLGKASSAHDAEVAAALRKADSIVRAAGLTWGDVIVAAPEPAPEPPPAPEPKHENSREAAPSWRDRCREILANAPTPWEKSFCAGLLRSWAGALTPKQAGCLERIYALRVEPMQRRA